MLVLAFHRDSRQAANARFLGLVQTQTPLVTIYAVMELLGHLSFNLPPDRLAQWPSWLQDRYNLTVLYPLAAEADAWVFFSGRSSSSHWIGCASIPCLTWIR